MLLRGQAFVTASSDCQDRWACVRNLDVFANANVKFSIYTAVLVPFPLSLW